MSEKTFAQYEQEGWQRNAADYDEIYTPVMSQAIAPLLDCVGDLHSRRVLELASGTGLLTEHAVASGAIVVGIDVESRDSADGISFDVPSDEFEGFRQE